MGVTITVDNFGYVNNVNITNSIHRFTISNGKILMQLINYGATITSLQVPSISKKIDDIVLGYDDILCKLSLCNRKALLNIGFILF